MFAANHHVVVKDHALVGHVFQTLNTDDWLRCVLVCLANPICGSYNFNNKGFCELNDCRLEDMCDLKKSLILSRGFVFQQLQPAQKVLIQCIYFVSEK